MKIILMFILSVVFSIGAEVIPHCDCIENMGNEGYRIWFGYENTGTATVTIPIGDGNKLTGGGLDGIDQGQLRVFEQNVHNRSFSVHINGGNINWVLDGTTVTGNTSLPPCTKVDFTKISNQPNFVRTYVYNDNGNPPQVLTEYKDGLGRVIETQSLYYGVNEYDATVQTYDFDEFGRQDKTYLPFPTISNGEFLGIQKAAERAKNYYTDANQYPYSEKKFCANPLNRDSLIGAPGLEYSLAGANPTRIWYFGTKAGATDRDTKGFLTCGALNNLIALTPVKPTEVTDATHLLIVTCDPNGSFSQQLKNVFIDKVMVNWSNTNIPPTPDGIIISENLYTSSGLLLKEIPPGSNLVSSTTYRYNTAGQVIYRDTPDGCIEEYEYTNTGKLLKVVSKNRTSVVIREIEYKYDELDRLEGIYVGADKTPKVLNYYDAIYSIPKEKIGRGNSLLEKLGNLKGRLAATISFGEAGNKVVEIFSYDDYGRIVFQAKEIPGKLQTNEFEYDLQGNLLKKIINTGRERIVKKYEYDGMGRIEKIKQENPDRVLTTYNYDEIGHLKFKHFFTNNSYTEQYTYSIRNWLESISSSFYNQELDYTGNFDGNIANISYLYKRNSVDLTFKQKFTYDGTKRLKKVEVVNGTYAQGTAEYNYDQAGRLQTKTEGTSVNSGYEYYKSSSSNTSRLKKVKGTDSRFIYDEFGNMVVDKEKKMVVQYDYRDLPVFFRFYSSIPSQIMPDAEGIIQITGYTGSIYDYMEERIKESGSTLKLVSIVSMLYDANGNRVIKSEGILP